MARTRSYRRRMRIKKARRKVKLIKEIWGYDDPYLDRPLGFYSKNKIHCSCPMCAAKTNNRGHYGPTMNWRIRDRRQLDEMDYDEEELDFE